MEEIVKQRIKQILCYYKVSQNHLSDGDAALQVKFSRQLNGNTSLSFQTISFILVRFPEVSAEWLMRGEGSMLKTASALTYNATEEECLGKASCPINDTAAGLESYRQLEHDALVALIDERINMRLSNLQVSIAG